LLIEQLESFSISEVKSDFLQLKRKLRLNVPLSAKKVFKLIEAGKLTLKLEIARKYFFII
jgi:hypothetical protein